MSRIGKHPVPVPAGVDVNVNGQVVTAKGRLGQLSMTLIDDIAASLEDGKVVVKPRHADSKRGKVMWATSRTLVANMVKGVSEGFTVNLEINGVGYRAAVQVLARRRLPDPRRDRDQDRASDRDLRFRGRPSEGRPSRRRNPSVP